MVVRTLRADGLIAEIMSLLVIHSFISAYVLSKAYETFPTGFHDLYNGKTYEDYMKSGNWDISGGKPDGIPDLLEELKYATDWIIKATPNATTFYYEKGEGNLDHKTWVTAGKMSSQSVDQGGEPRKMWKNPNDGHMASFAAATLAIMSRIYKKFDNSYSQTCLEHAKNAYDYAKPKKNAAVGAASGGFYGSPKSPVQAFIVAASEMYKATGKSEYRSDIIDNMNQITDHYYAFDYSNFHDLAPYTVATSIDSLKTPMLEKMKSLFISKYTGSVNEEKVCTKGNSGWGALRYPANHAFVTALYSSAMKTEENDQFIYDQVDYIMGANNAKQSFIVGFCSGCSKSPQLPHHRNVFLRDDNPNDGAKASMTIPDRNKQFGYLVGGSWTSSSYKESVIDYAMTEGGIDYNAGLVGALAYIVSKLSPADTTYNDNPSSVKTINKTGSGLSIKSFGKMVTISSPALIKQCTIYALNGTSVFSLKNTVSEIKWNTTGIKHGLYLISLQLNNGTSICSNLLVR